MTYFSFCELCEACDCYHQRRRLAQANPPEHGAHLNRIAIRRPHPRRPRLSE